MQKSWYSQYKTASVIIDPDSPYKMSLEQASDSGKLFTSIDFQTENEYYQISLRFTTAVQGNMSYGDSSRYMIVYYNGPDDDLIKEVISMSGGFKQFHNVRFQEGRNPMMSIIEKATGEEYVDPTNPNYEEELEKGMKPLPKGLKIGGPKILTVIGPYPGEIEYVRNSIIKSFDKALNSLVSEERIEYYSISGNEKQYKSEKSKSFEKKILDKKRQDLIFAGKYLYLLNLLLKDYPNVKSFMINKIKKRFPDAVENNEKVNIRESETLDDLSENSGYVFNLIHKNFLTMSEKSEKTIQRIERILGDKEISDYEQLINLLEDDESYDFYFREFSEGKFMYAYILFSNPSALKRFESYGYSSRIEGLKNAIVNGIDSVIESGHLLDLERILPYKQYLKLESHQLSAIDQAEAEVEKYKAEQNRTREEQDRMMRENDIKNSRALTWDKSYVDLNGELFFHQIDRYDSFGEFIVLNKEEFDWYEDSIWYDAYEQAEEEARMEMPERPSDNYGSNNDSVESDMLYEADDFLESINFFDNNPSIADQIDSLNPDQQKQKLMELVLQMKPQFIEWKRQKMIEEEDQEGIYDEPDPSEIDEKISEFEEPIAEQHAYRNGLVYIEYEEIDRGGYGHNKIYSQDIYINLHNKFLEKFKPVLRDFVNKNIEDERFDKTRRNPEITISLIGDNGDILEQLDGWSLIS